MDERKRSSKLKKIFGLITLSSFLIFASYAAYIFFTLPKINDPNTCFKTKMFEIYLCPKNKGYIRYSHVPKIFIRSLVLSEDAAFFSHKGLDWHEIEESFRRNFKEWKFARGGSTLTQQLAKNLYLTPKKTIARKIQEFFIAKELEEKLKKTEILEKYVNVVEFGKNIYGLNKASYHYFSKHPSELNLIESVYLVSLLPSPVRLGKSFSAKKLNKSNLWRMKIILGRLFRSGRITEEVYLYAKDISRTHAWPFPHYNEERSYLGDQYDNEETELESSGEDQKEDIDSDEIIEEEIESINESHIDDGSFIQNNYSGKPSPNEESPPEKDGDENSIPNDSMEIKDAESPEN